jgi:hypothetical protein
VDRPAAVQESRTTSDSPDGVSGAKLAGCVRTQQRHCAGEWQPPAGHVSLERQRRRDRGDTAHISLCYPTEARRFAEATYRQGMLELVLPLKESAKLH